VDDPIAVHDAAVADLDPVTLYRILALRVDVFVVEQVCAYPELDGRDLEPGARLVWATRGDDVVATLRVLIDAGGEARIGRVATARGARSGGLAARLMQRALVLADELAPGRDVVLDAQSRLESWYAQYGFTRVGPDFDEDGIAHLPMRRSAAH
jgi:ElaA protein